MKKRTKWILFSVIGVVVVVVATPIVAFKITMAGDSPVHDGEALGMHGKQIQDGFVSFAVIDVGHDSVALVDCGNDTTAKALNDEFAKRKITSDAVKAIFITHGHGDHLGVCSKFPKAEIYAMAADVDLIEGRATSNGFITKHMGKHDSGARVTHPLADGDIIKVGDQTVTAFAVPGHTQGSAVYLIDGVLYFGDAASASTSGKITPAKFLFSDDQKQAIASLKALEQKLEPRESEIKTLEFAHTGTLSGFWPLRVFVQEH